jgi:hypothetical protein
MLRVTRDSWQRGAERRRSRERERWRSRERERWRSREGERSEASSRRLN